MVLRMCSQQKGIFEADTLFDGLFFIAIDHNSLQQREDSNQGSSIDIQLP